MWGLYFGGVFSSEQSLEEMKKLLLLLLGCAVQVGGVGGVCVVVCHCVCVWGGVSACFCVSEILMEKYCFS